MNYKKIGILLLLCIIAFSIASVNAASQSDMNGSQNNGADLLISQDANDGLSDQTELIKTSNQGISSSNKDTELIKTSNQGISSSNKETELIGASNENLIGSQITVTDSSSIQDAIDSSKDGDTISLGQNKEYTINETITITKKLTITADNVIINTYSQGRIFEIKGSDGSTIRGITFKNLNPVPDYGGTITGTAIYSQGNKNLTIDNCSFINFANGAYLTSTESSTIRNSYFTGVTTGVKSSETGTKAVNIMSCSNINIINNSFEGQVLDGLSIATGSSNILIEANRFINNTYAIFYGGASTAGSKIINNTFITCGMINATWYSSYLNRSFDLSYQNLPYISLQKASNNLEIINNTFMVNDENMIIISEAENTAHGYPSTIGSINITDNTVLRADESVNPKTVTFYYLNVLSSLSLTPTGDIIVKNNNFSDVEGINDFELKFSSIESSDGSILIPKAYTETYLSLEYVKDGRAIIVLYDINGMELGAQKVTYTINGQSAITDLTDEYGHIYIDNIESEAELKISYGGSDTYKSCEMEATVKATESPTETMISASNLSVYAINAKSTVYKFSLKDSERNLLANKEVSIAFNGKIYTRTSDINGTVSFTLPTATAGKYQVTLAYTGNGAYKGCVKLTTITIQKQATKLSVAKKTFKKAASKKLTAVLKDNKGKVIKSRKISLKVNGKTYTAKTNAKGIATFTIKLTKKGTFTATTKFAGDSYYTGKTTSSKIIVK